MQILQTNRSSGSVQTSSLSIGYALNLEFKQIIALAHVSSLEKRVPRILFPLAQIKLLACLFRLRIAFRGFPPRSW